MDDMTQRLTNCFRVVFPDLPEAQIAASKQSTVKEWDSVATITLVNVVEEEFNIELDLDNIADLDTFEKIAQYLRTLQVPS